MDYVTIEGVELAHVGLDWPASTGPVTLTMQHLADAVTAATKDPHILVPRLKIGHVDPRFGEDPPVVDPFKYAGPLTEDGEPVYGKVANLRLAEDGMVLLGDYVAVPEWLGNALPSAYPSRSLEGDFDIKTEGGKTYSFVITAVALLGEPLPAITCLEDLELMLAEGPAAVAAAQAARTESVNARRDTMPVAAEASTDAIRGQFWDDVAVGDRFYWWPCEIRSDSGYVLADDDEGHLFRLDFTTDGDGNVSFGDPVQGVLDFREVPNTERNEPVAASRGVVRFATAADAGRPKDRVRAATTTTGGTTVENTALLERLGLPEDATEEQIQEATLAKLDELDAAAPPADSDDGVVEPVVAAPVKEPVAAATMDPAAYEQLREDARLGREAREQQLQMARDTFVDAAVAAGKFPPARRDHYLQLMSKDEQGTRDFITSLSAGLVPIEERGVAPAAANAVEDLGWFPQFDPLKTKETVNG